MTENLEARIKALEEKLTPSPEKMSTMKATNRLKQTLEKMKGEKDTQEDVVWKLIEQAQKVPELENEISKFEHDIIELSFECDDLRNENEELKNRIEELEKKHEV